MFLLGSWYMDRKGVPQDMLVGYKWARRASETCIERGVNVENNKASLVEIDALISQLTGGAVPSGDGDGLEAALRRRAEAGDAKAGCELGEALMARGEAAEAVKWVRWAAEEKAFMSAMALLGEWYSEGKGVPQDELEAFKWWRRAYETNIERGIDVEHYKAMLVKADAKISLLTGGAGSSGGGDGLEAELRRLAEAGDADAGCVLGETLMARGEEAEAVKWVRWAAEEKGDAEAMKLLGEWYDEGKGVPQDQIESCKWSRRACETAIERGVEVEANTASLAACDAHICRLSGGPDVSSVNRTAVKKAKARLEEDPENKGLADMLEQLQLERVCDGCGASARDEGVRLSICTRCRQAFFCSQACLERSYERHEPDCTRLRAQRKRERAEAKEAEEKERAEGW